MTNRLDLFHHALAQARLGATVYLSDDDILNSWGLSRTKVVHELQQKNSRLRAALNIICENVEATGSSHADRVAMIGNVANAALKEAEE